MDDLLRHSPFVVLRVDAAARIVEWNPRAAATLGLREADRGRSIEELVGSIAGGSWSAIVASPHEGRELSELRRPDGSSLRYQWWLQLAAQGGALCFGAAAEDAADGRAVMERDVLRTLLDTLPITAWVLDPEGTYLYSDGRALESIGARPGQFVGHSVFDLFRGQPALETLRRGLAGESGHDSSSRDGLEFDNWQAPIRDASGKVIKLIGITLDVTVLKRTASELQAKLDVIERQQRAIREMSTPIIEVWDRVLTLPIVGLVDSTRTAEIMENLLQAVVRYRARYAILDLTGVEVVDTSTASHILGLIRTIRLLGAEGILTGIHPSIAQTIVTLGVDLAGLIVRSTLREALHHCIIQMAKKPAAPQ